MSTRHEGVVTYNIGEPLNFSKGNRSPRWTNIDIGTNRGDGSGF